ncbi:MAG TPA: hypothetical protein VID50_10505 [Candidatus Eisenbacteria bacterium]
MLRFAALALLVVALSLATGCSKFVLDARSMTEVVSMTSNTNAPAGGEATAFKRTAKAAYLGLVANLVTLTQPDVPTLLRAEINSKGGTSVRNLKIDKKITFLDGLISMLTLGIYNQETITLEGEVVKAAP